MKSLHFCTKELLEKLHAGEYKSVIETYRTGLVPSMYSGEIINLNEKMPVKPDKFVRKGKIEWVMPLQYKELKSMECHKKAFQEIFRYKRKFHDDHWFFSIGVKLGRLILSS